MSRLSHFCAVRYSPFIRRIELWIYHRLFTSWASCSWVFPISSRKGGSNSPFAGGIASAGLMMTGEKGKEMNLTIFAKKRTSSEGKTFFTYLTTLRKKNGEELRCSVKFRQDCGNPKGEDCPMNIIVPKSGANLSVEKYTDEDTGELLETARLWVSEWKKGEAYVDHSLDDFED